MKIKLPLFRLSLLSSVLLLPASLCLAAKQPEALLPFLKQRGAASQLGWISKPGCKNLCGGFYVDPPLPKLLLSPDFIQIKADSSELRQEGRSKLQGNIVINQAPDRQLIADKAYIYRNAAGEYTRLDLSGTVRIQEPGKYIVGKKAHIRLPSKQGEYYDALYRLTLDPASYSPALQNAADTSGRALTAYGHADEIQQVSKGKLALDNANYTTCAPTSESWRLKAKRIDIDQPSGRGVAHHAVITVKDFPVFYTPYFNFPIDKRRQSGLLFPLFSSSNTGGFTFGIPYYWNIAPNYDLTITPTYYAKRGLQFSNLFRYLTAASSGNLRYAFLPNDNAFNSFKRSASAQFSASGKPALSDLLTASDTRQYISWQHSTVFNPHWSSAIDYTRASDDYYLLDFNNIPLAATPNQLLQQAKVNYNNERWSFQGMLQQYQTLHPVTLADVANQYARLPQLLLAGNFPDNKTGLVYQLNSEMVHFWRPKNPGERITPVSGDRMNLQPGISLPIIGSAGFITPTVQLNLTQYSLANQPSPYTNTLFRSVPIVSIDSGIFFDRNLSFAGKDYQQTLEPRLFYLYVPYRQQYQLPLFDSGLQVFNYDQLFRTNRFTGIDRIGDANQITLALTTRFIDQETGQEKLRASIGQIYYFRDRKVMLCGTQGCIDPVTAVGATSNTANSSPIAGQFSYAINTAWSANSNITWDPHTRRTQNGSFNFQYIPKAQYVFNAGYNFVRYGDVLVSSNPSNSQNNLNQAAFSFAMPIRHNWRTVGGLTYNLSHEHSQSFFYGAEYNSCCWASRLVVAHTFTGLNSDNAPLYNKVIYLQLLLKGMGNVGTNDPGIVVNAIPGYQDNFGRS